MKCSKCNENPRYKDSSYCYPCMNEYLKSKDRFGFRKDIVIKDVDAHEKLKFLAAVRGQKMYEVTTAAINNEFDRHVEKTKDLDTTWLNKIIKK